MPKTVDRTTLQYLGVEFQEKLVKCFFEDQRFFQNLEGIVDQNMFTDECLRRIVGIMRDRYAEAEVVCTYFDAETLIRSRISDAISLEKTLKTLEKIKNSELDGMDLVEEESEKFFKQQKLVKAINKAQDIIKKGDHNSYDQIEGLFKDALEVNLHDDYATGLFDHIESDLSEDYRATIPTGADELDASLFGGISKGELGLIVAPLGVGKTSVSTGFGASAALYKCKENNYSGYKVLHYYFEDKDSSIRRKYFGYYTEIDAQSLSTPEWRPIALAKLGDETSEVRQMLKNNVRIKRLRTGETSATDIKRKIKQEIARGFKPDLVIVDYFECVKPEPLQTHNENEWTREGITMRKFESMCDELDIAMWIPIQGNRESIGADIVGISQAGGSVKKLQIGHIVITLAASESMKERSLITVAIGKFRAGKVGRTRFVEVGFNNGTCRFDFTAEDDGSYDNYITQSGPDVNIAKNVKKNYGHK